MLWRFTWGLRICLLGRGFEGAGEREGKEDTIMKCRIG
jgi:hypothetical protein